MGFIRKITGVQGQIDATNANAKAQEDATREAARMQQQSLMESARAAADSQAQQAARMAVEQKAADVAGAPLESADVQLDQNSPDSVTATRSKRRAAFGRNYASSGVSI